MKKFKKIILFAILITLLIGGYKYGPSVLKLINNQVHFFTWRATLVETEYGQQYGNPDAQTVFLHSQGGPSPELEGLENFSQLR